MSSLEDSPPQYQKWNYDTTESISGSNTPDDYVTPKNPGVMAEKLIAERTASNVMIVKAPAARSISVIVDRNRRAARIVGLYRLRQAYMEIMHKANLGGFPRSLGVSYMNGV
uniref:Plug domain-containing protein n=1 Tax=Heterorhabditis bacteriophora TaxID=37862 RepID=A0A1I7X3S3_HETBA